MDELNAIQSQPTPRDPALARTLGRRFVPAWGFVAYGVLYAFLVGGPVGIMALLGLALAFGNKSGQPLSPAMLVAVPAGGLAAFALSWWRFARFVARRRREAERLFRDGQLVDGVVVRAWRVILRGTSVTRAVVRFTDERSTREATVSVAGEPAAVVPEARVALLACAGCRYVAVFVDGRATAAR
jgi:hypothetical protein